MRAPGALAPRALGVAAGLLLDRTLGEPPARWHPVAWFGSFMGGVEGFLYDDRRTSGLRYAAVGAGLGAAVGAALGTAGTPGLAAAVATASAGRMLRHTSRDIGTMLDSGDLSAARERLPWLVGRDPSGLDESGIAAAVVESLAENTVDAVVAPAFWGLVGGAPGVLVHRAVNTMDAMVGHRSPRYARFGTAAARADDVMAWVPARIFAALVALDAAAAVLCARIWSRCARYVVCTGSAPVHRVGEVGASVAGGAEAGSGGVDRGGAIQVLTTVRRYAAAHPSPNAGVAESAVAGALGVRLGGPLRYGDRVEDRPTLGQGPRPRAQDIDRACGLVDRVELTIVGAAVAGWVLGSARRVRRRRRR